MVPFPPLVEAVAINSLHRVVCFGAFLHAHHSVDSKQRNVTTYMPFLAFQLGEGDLPVSTQDPFRRFAINWTLRIALTHRPSLWKLTVDSKPFAAPPHELTEDLA